MGKIMTFNLNLLKKTDDTVNATKTITYNGLEITLEAKKDAEFESAFAQVSELLNKKVVITKDSLKRGNSGIGAFEALFFVIGEYCVKSWNIVVDDKPFAISGDNFLAVLENAFSDTETLQAFMTEVLNGFNDVIQDFKNKVDEIKKKPLPNTTGKSKK